MSKFSSVMKEGWHPKGKDGGKESWRGEFKGIDQVAGWMGKEKQRGSGNGNGNGNGNGRGSEHISRPLASLQDPALFGRPPKNVNYRGGAALPNEITPDRRGLIAPLDRGQIENAEGGIHAPSLQEVEETRPPGPRVPYRGNRTGLKTDHLPPPPTHRALSDVVSSQSTGIAQAPPKPKPSLPPRLPPRRESSNASLSVVSPPSAPPTYDAAVREPTPTSSSLNQRAMDRLGKAGVSVPALNIGESNPWKNEKSHAEKPMTPNSPQLSELQSRFSRMSSGSPNPTSPATEGTTFAQKQAALRTAQDFQKDPSSVTLGDAKTAASTANNFRARHQEQISAGTQKAGAWNKKYNVTGRMNSFLEQHASPTSEHPSAVQSPVPAPGDASGFGNRNPPRPPPKKPQGMHAQPAGGHVPPPVPLGTKPSFG